MPSNPFGTSSVKKNVPPMEQADHGALTATETAASTSASCPSSWATSPASATKARAPRSSARPGRGGRLLVQQFLDPAQCAAQGFRISPGTAQRERPLKLGSDGIRDGLQRFRCISLRSAALHGARGTIDKAKCAGFHDQSVVERIVSRIPLPPRRTPHRRRLRRPPRRPTLPRRPRRSGRRVRRSSSRATRSTARRCVRGIASGSPRTARR